MYIYWNSIRQFLNFALTIIHLKEAKVGNNRIKNRTIRKPGKGKPKSNIPAITLNQSSPNLPIKGQRLAKWILKKKCAVYKIPTLNILIEVDKAKG